MNTKIAIIGSIVSAFVAGHFFKPGFESKTDLLFAVAFTLIAISGAWRIHRAVAQKV